MTFWAKTLFQGQSSRNGDIKVIESFGERRLIAAGYTQSRNLNKKGLTGSYWDGFIQNIPSLGKDSRVLILGLAGGTIAKLLTNKFGPIAIDGVEIDPLMVELGKKFFDFKEKNVNIIVEDALKFVSDARYKYDLVAVDLFSHGAVAVGTESEEFFIKVKKLVNSGGVVVINKIFEDKAALERYMAFIDSIFTTSDVLLIRGSVRTDNVIIYAYP